MQRLVDDLLHLQEEGFCYQGERWRIVCLGVKGDMPFQIKLGRFTRHWLRAVRTEDRQGHGVCWLCMAGTRVGGPYEDFNASALWARSGTVAPWPVQPSVLSLHHCPDRPWDYFKPDVWHNYHGGAGKSFIASGLAECLWLCSGNMHERCAELNDALHDWARLPGNSLPHSGPFCAERISLTSYAVLPEGSWSKFHDTYLYHRFVEHFLGQREEACRNEPLLETLLAAVRTINTSFSTLYSSGLWLLPNEAFVAGRAGREWIRLHAELSFMCYNAHRLRFPTFVKTHMLDHAFRRLLEGSRHPYSLNILAESVQADEDASL